MFVVVALLIFGAIILVHEMGHFLAARRVGIEVEEFAIGFGPRLTGFRAAGTNFSVRLLPLGGYVRMLGEEDNQEVVSEGSYNSKSPLQRMLVIASGPIMNFLFAVLLFVLIFGVVGLPLNEARIGGVLPGSPAETAGFQPGDVLLEIDSQPLSTWVDLQQAVGNSQGETLSVLVEREGEVITLSVTPRVSEGHAEIGVSPATRRLGILSSIKEGVRQTYEITVLVLQSLYQIITRQLPADDLTGPIGIIYFVGEAARAGLVNVLSLAAIISVNLGLFNLLPIPALDGSKLVFLGIELVRRRPLDPQKENLVHLVGFALLISLMVFVMYRDILRFWVR